MITYEMEELAERLSGLTEKEITQDEEFRGLSTEEYDEFGEHVHETTRDGLAHMAYHLYSNLHGDEQRFRECKLEDTRFTDAWKRHDEARAWATQQTALLTEIRDLLREGAA